MNPSNLCLAVSLGSTASFRCGVLVLCCLDGFARHRLSTAMQESLFFLYCTLDCFKMCAGGHTVLLHLPGLPFGDLRPTLTVQQFVLLSIAVRMPVCALFG
jgi:hypothetical protein